MQALFLNRRIFAIKYAFNFVMLAIKLKHFVFDQSGKLEAHVRKKLI